MTFLWLKLREIRQIRRNGGAEHVARMRDERWLLAEDTVWWLAFLNSNEPPGSVIDEEFF